MPELVLFHYDLSPFSEKVRAMLGYAGLDWYSAKVSEMPPRPVLDLLTGGYRKIPVAQIGADVYCDTRTIARQIARLGNCPSLILEDQPEDVQAFVARTDLDIFLACVIAASDLKMLRSLVRQTSLLHTLKFLKDRITMGRKARVRPVRGPEAKQTVLNHMADMEQRLTEDFLFGATPCIADFSAYHGLWFVCDLAGKPWLRDYPKVASWMARMRAFGHGQPTELTAEAALEMARSAQPVALPDADGKAEGIGRTVVVAPTDYGLDPVRGRLVYEGPNERILARETPETGLVHVHFPVQGFSVS
ncbi:glutathione S-transferase family protein [Marinobacter sp. C2H3]|uniref:glutathione S-transferase family protein n=1 Tax=Marinobacter sp. C2H3 TaxID=3119003 RepID=UPI00300F19EA